MDGPLSRIHGKRPESAQIIVGSQHAVDTRRMHAFHTASPVCSSELQMCTVKDKVACQVVGHNLAFCKGNSHLYILSIALIMNLTLISQKLNETSATQHTVDR